MQAVILQARILRVRFYEKVGWLIAGALPAWLRYWVIVRETVATAGTDGDLTEVTGVDMLRRCGKEAGMD